MTAFGRYAAFGQHAFSSVMSISYFPNGNFIARPNARTLLRKVELQMMPHLEMFDATALKSPWFSKLLRLEIEINLTPRKGKIKR